MPDVSDLIPDAALSSSSEPVNHDPVADLIPDAALSANESTPASTAPSTVYDADLFRKRVGRDPSPTELANFKASKGEGWAGSKGTPGGSFTGLGEAALAVGAGAVRGISGAANDILPDWNGSKTELGKQIAQDPILGYRGGPEAQPYLQGFNTLMSPVTWAADKAHQGIANVAGQRTADIAGDVATLLPAARGASASGALNKVINSMDDPETAGTSSLNSPQSLGAAKTPLTAGASPELQAAIGDPKYQSKGTTNQTAVERVKEAESLPVPMKLTPGQASGDVSLISNEQNLRGTDQRLAQNFNDQNTNLVKNIQALRDQVGPDVFTTNPVEHGDTLINAYKDKAAAADTDIDAKYQALRDAYQPSEGGSKVNFPVDAQKLLSNASDALHQDLLFEHAPTAVMGQLKRLADSNNMTFEQFEAMRTNLARIQRSSTDGNEVAAAGVIRDAMEGLPLKSGAENLKPLADAARGAARAQFQALEADPAYKAAVNDKVPADRFVQKFVVGGNRDDVANMKANLADNPTATQTMGVAALDHLRQAAGIDPMGNGNFSRAGFNKQFQALSPKMGSLVDPKTAEHLETLGNVARYTQEQPRGAFVNNSNTFVAQAANAAASALEGAINVKAGGVPLGTWGRNIINKRSKNKAVSEILDPYGGFKVPMGSSKLSDVVK